MPKRFIYIDNIRSVLIALVIMVHAGVTYSGMGSWFYKEGTSDSLDLPSKLFFGIFQSFNQAYFMSLLFLFAGYFAASSFKRKGAGQFLSDRFWRLGAPTILFVFVLFPVCVMLANPGIDVSAFYLNGLKSFAFLSWTGPLWFALALLFFSIIYAAAAKQVNGIHPTLVVTAKSVLLLAVLMAALSFAVRIAYPIDSSWYNMQIPFFPSYVIFFIVGLLGHSGKIFDGIDYRTGRRWVNAAIFVGLPLWLFIMVLGGAVSGLELFKGGLNWQAAAYSFWEAYFCVAFSIGLIGIFKEEFNRETAANKFLSDNSFGAYVFHAPILILVTVLLKGFTIYPIAKFIIASALAVPASFVFAGLVKKSGLLKKSFL